MFLKNTKRQLKDNTKFLLLTFLIVNSILFTINMVINPEILWFIFPLLGWSLLLLLKFLKGKL